MKKKSPIFINGFSRGGTNILLNIIASNAEVSLLNCETHELFYGKGNESIIKKVGKRVLYAPVLINAQQPLFKPTFLEERNKVSPIMLRYLDLILFLNKMDVDFSNDNRSGDNDSIDVSRGSRLLCKNINGTVFLTPLFAEMYENAKFIGLVRNGLALCEGFVRRGWGAGQFGRLYQKVCDKMLYDAKNMNNLKLFQFEKLITDPENTIKNIYTFLELDILTTKKFRLQAKPSMGVDGKRVQTFGTRFKEMNWFELTEIKSQFRENVNQNQIRQLNDTDKNEFLNYAHDAMVKFNYL